MAKIKNTPEMLDKIPLEFTKAKVLERFKLRNMNERIDAMVDELIDMVKSIARPKVLYKESTANVRDGNSVELDGVELSSYLPSLNFARDERVFPYVATCGTEIDAVKIPNGDFMRRYCLDVIKMMVLWDASNYLQNHLITSYGLTELTRIGPGEALGPIAQQQKLFSVLGDVESEIGVRLSPHNLMVPEKSSSGIYFETAIKLESCALCPDVKCKGRRATYEPALLAMHHSN